MEAAIIGSLLNFSSTSNITELEPDFNTNGCTIHKLSNIHIWLIHCRVSNVKNIKLVVIEIYKGTQKPNDPNIFFNKFITDVRIIISNGGINFCGNKIPIKLRCFLAGAPARPFILNHRGHVFSSVF